MNGIGPYRNSAHGRICMEKICLNRDWRLHEAPLSFDRTALPRVLALPDGWLSCDIPCDVHVPLQEAGIARALSELGLI